MDARRLPVCPALGDGEWLLYVNYFGIASDDLLAEVKRNDKGTVEVKLIDRIRALDGLLNAGSADSGCADAFFAAAGDDDAD